MPEKRKISETQTRLGEVAFALGAGSLLSQEVTEMTPWPYDEYIAFALIAFGLWRLFPVIGDFGSRLIDRDKEAWKAVRSAGVHAFFGMLLAFVIFGVKGERVDDSGFIATALPWMMGFAAVALVVHVVWDLWSRVPFREYRQLALLYAGLLEDKERVQRENALRRLANCNRNLTPAKGLQAFIFYTDAQESDKAEDLKSLFKTAGWDVEIQGLSTTHKKLPKGTRIAVEGDYAHHVRDVLRDALGIDCLAQADAKDLPRTQVRVILVYPPKKSERWPAQLQKHLVDLDV